MSKIKEKGLSPNESETLFTILKARFEKHANRHKGISWSEVHARLIGNPDKLLSLHKMEFTGGEPDLVARDTETGEYFFVDCATESPSGRRSICYDDEALASRKEHKPANSALNMAAEMGIDLLTEQQYRELQQLGKFDLKTSSWLQTPANIRKLDGAIFGDRRYDTVFIYHNGVQSYYAARGFRGLLKV